LRPSHSATALQRPPYGRFRGAPYGVPGRTGGDMRAGIRPGAIRGGPVPHTGGRCGAPRRQLCATLGHPAACQAVRAGICGRAYGLAAAGGVPQRRISCRLAQGIGGAWRRAGAAWRGGAASGRSWYAYPDAYQPPVSEPLQAVWEFVLCIGTNTLYRNGYTQSVRNRGTVLPPES
jgi:hypothetical protein